MMAYDSSRERYQRWRSRRDGGLRMHNALC